MSPAIRAFAWPRPKPYCCIPSRKPSEAQVFVVDPHPIVARGVYCEPYRRHGHWEYYAVDSHGDWVGTRSVRDGRDPASAIRELWDELNEADPITSSPPSLRLLAMVLVLVASDWTQGPPLPL